jgi:hypothetical protein
MNKFFFLLILLSLNSFAQSTKEKFCREHSSLKAIEKNMRNYENMLSMGNNSGFLGMKTGVCWWHSRFQRNLSYLVQMEPTLPAPSEKDVKEIVKKIIAGNEIVIVPGFSSFRNFTIKYEKFIQKGLNKWINTDFLVKQDWTRAFAGTGVMSVADFQNHLKETQEKFIESEGILFMVLQFNGPIAHSWLVTNMEKVKGGWNLSIVDSESALWIYDIFIDENASSMVPSAKYPQNKAYYNAVGYTFKDYPQAVGYVYQQPELKRIKKVLGDYCAK